MRPRTLIQSRSLCRLSMLLGWSLAQVACADDGSGGSTNSDAGGMASSANTGRFGFGPNGQNRPGRNDQPKADPSPIALPAATPVEDVHRTTCGEQDCRDVLIGDIVVPPCCPVGAQGECGLDLNAVSSFMPLEGQCAGLYQPGAADSTCPMVYFDDPVNPRQLPGCCLPEGLCGVVADFSDVLADFGCVDPRGFFVGHGPSAPTSQSIAPEAELSTPEATDASAARPRLYLMDGGGITEAGTGDSGVLVVRDSGVSDAPPLATTPMTPQALPDGLETLQSCVPRAPEPEPRPQTDAGRPRDGGSGSSKADAGVPVGPAHAPSGDAAANNGDAGTAPISASDASTKRDAATADGG